jgi:hypothetical protein
MLGHRIKPWSFTLATRKRLCGMGVSWARSKTMSYLDFDAFQVFLRDWLGETAVTDMPNVSSLWDEVQHEVPHSVVSAALWMDNAFAQELLKQAVYSVGAARLAAQGRPDVGLAERRAALQEQVRRYANRSRG